MHFSCKVALNQLPCDLTDYLVGRFTYHTSDEWSRHIVEGRVLVDGKPATPGGTICGGQTLTYLPLPFVEPPADLSYSIVYEDEWILGVNKPGNLLVHRAGKSFTNNLVYRVRSGYSCPPVPDAGAINRLDRETSGIVLLARNTRSLGLFQVQFREQAVTKEYLAVVHKGIVPIPPQIDFPVGPDRASAITYKHCVDTAQGKMAQTVIDSVNPCGASHAVICCMPLTGRTHQIRVHCSGAGWPIVGDKLYAMDENRYLEWRENPDCSGHLLEFPRQALHCRSLTFIHPVTKSQVTISAPVPPDMTTLIHSLGGEIPAACSP